MRPTKPFCYLEPVWKKEADALQFSEPEVPKIVQNMIMRKCCLILGPPTSGTTSTLLTVREVFQRMKPWSLWWHIDLKKLPNENATELFASLAGQATQFFPEHASLWDSIANADEFYRALLDSLTTLRRTVVIAIDHMESASLPIATSIVRIVRLLYTQRDDGFTPQQLAVVVMAGSRRLLRQGVGKGSPLYFAEKHYVQDVDLETATGALLSLGINHGWSFTSDAARLLAETTEGDKYLIQRLGHECIDDIIRNGEEEITVNCVKRVLDKFVETEFLDDPHLSGLLPALVQDLDSMRLVLDLLKGTGSLVPQLELLRTNPAPSVTQVLKEINGSVVIRNAVYRRILLRYRPLIEAVRDTLTQTREKTACIRDFQNNVSRFEFSFSQQDLQTALETIRNLVKANSAYLLTFHENLHQLRPVGSSLGLIENQPISELLTNSLIAAFKSEKERIPCPLINECLADVCVAGMGGNCSWIPLRVHDSPDLVGALAISGQPLVMSPSWENELLETGAILANAIKRQQHFAGLRQLSSLSVDLSKDTFQQEICRIASFLFNKPNTFFWYGSKQQKFLHLRAAIGLDVERFPQFYLDLRCLPLLQKECPDPILIHQDENNPRTSSFKGLMSSVGVCSLFLICVPMWQDQVSVLGIGASSYWNPTDEENTLAQLMAKQAEVILANLAAFQQIEQRLELSRLSVPLLSHELKRWPTAIAEDMELLLDGRIGTLKQSQREFLAQVKDDTITYKQLIQKLLDFTSLDAGVFKTNMKVLPILQVLSDTLGQIRPRIEKEGRSLVINLPLDLPSHLLDDILIDRILTNLLQNAVQHTNDGPIQVSAWENDGATFVVVEDTGPGISPFFRQHIFEPWQRGPRLHQPGGPQGNLGLGLFLVKKMMDLLGGEIVYDEEYTSGARFILTFPCLEGQQNEPT